MPPTSPDGSKAEGPSVEGGDGPTAARSPADRAGMGNGLAVGGAVFGVAGKKPAIGGMVFLWYSFGPGNRGKTAYRPGNGLKQKTPDFSRFSGVFRG